jgi:SNF2 family DNA or RNA helicase
VGLARLRIAMSQLALRRTKAEVESMIQLVEKTVEIRIVSFPEGWHKQLHDEFYETCRTAFIGLLAAGGKSVYQNFFALFGLVLRVRQACCHGGLIPYDYRQRIRMMWEEFQNVDVDQLSKEEGKKLFEKLIAALKKSKSSGSNEEEEESQECCICLGGLVENSAIILKSCMHIFCREVSLEANVATCTTHIRTQKPCCVTVHPMSTHVTDSRSSLSSSAWIKSRTTSALSVAPRTIRRKW